MMRRMLCTVGMMDAWREVGDGKAGKWMKVSQVEKWTGQVEVKQQTSPGGLVRSVGEVDVHYR